MSSKASVLLVGGGGVGTIAALNLQKGGSAAVTMVLRSNYVQVTKHGYSIESEDHGTVTNWKPTQVLAKVPDMQQDESKGFDFVVIATKSIPDNPPPLVAVIQPAVGHSTAIVLLQNGLNIEKPFISAFPNNTILSAISMMGSREVEPGVIKHVGHDSLLVGVFPGQQSSVECDLGVKSARRFCTLYSAAEKATCTYDPDVAGNRWRKLVYNASLNPICAITGLDTGRIRLAEDTITTLIRPAMEEIRECATAAGHPLPDNIADIMIEVDPIEMRYVPSMLEDLRKENLIEYENILGEPLRTGQRLGIPMPTIGFLYSTCKAIQWRLKQQKSAVGKARIETGELVTA